jgi:hypothetical protein
LHASRGAEDAVSVEKKYEPIRDLLSGCGRETVSFSFDELAAVVGGLPPSAFVHDAWWRDATPATRHTQASDGWLAAGYRVVALDRPGRRVTFSRASGFKPPFAAS